MSLSFCGVAPAALSEQPRPGGARKLSGQDEALLVATACSGPPEGRKRWTLTLLADAMVRLTEHDGLSRETVRRRLAENALEPWRRHMRCVPEVDGAYVACMEVVPDLYAEQPDPKRPVSCFDESPMQLIGQARQLVPAAPGRPERYDYECRLNGMANLFVFVDVHRSWREVKVTGRRTAADFAPCIRDLVDVHRPDADRIRVVLDNLSSHSPGALYEASERVNDFETPGTRIEAWPASVFGGGLIHAATGLARGRGAARTNRCGLARKARSRTC